MRYKFADRVQLVVLDDERVFLIDDEILELEGCTKSQCQALQLLKAGCEAEALDEVLNQLEREELFEFLTSQELLRENWSNEYTGQIVEKQIYYLDDFGLQPNEYQHNLERSTVAIVGVGGVGSVVLQHLVGAGVKSFVLIDADYVQQDNLNRQFIYSNEDLGRVKVEAARDYIHRIDSTILVTTYQRMIDEEDSLDVLDAHAVDLLINAADQPVHLYRLINGYCTRRRLPWVGAGVGRHVGSWGPFVIPDQTICTECYYKIEDEMMDELELAIRQRIKPTLLASFGATNTVISSLLAKDAIHYLALKDPSQVASTGARCTLDFRTLNVSKSAPATAESTCSCWKGVPAWPATV